MYERALGQGPKSGAPGPVPKIWCTIGESTFFWGMNLWYPRCYKLSTIFDIPYTGDYANYILYTIYHILATVYYRIETRY